MVELSLKGISEPSIRRLLLYVRLLGDLKAKGHTTTSSNELADIAGASPSQVRRDLRSVGALGKRGSGYLVDSLLDSLRKALDIGVRKVVIVGAGKVGLALARYEEFASRGFEVVGVFDTDPAKIGQRFGGHTILDAATMCDAIARLRPTIALLTVPASEAQRVATALATAGIRGILNFAPTRLQTEPSAIVQNVDMTTELEVLAIAVETEG